jgi:hypothetical protein
MVPGIRIEVTAIPIAGAITTDGGIGITTLEAAWQYTVERNGNMYKSFPRLCAVIHIGLGREAVLDGGIVILNAEDHVQFYELFRHRGGVSTSSISYGWMVRISGPVP